MALKTFIELCIDNHPCEKSYIYTAVEPDCLKDEYGRCDMYENAIFCPKYGKPIGVINAHGMHLVDIEEKKEREDG